MSPPADKKEVEVEAGTETEQEAKVEQVEVKELDPSLLTKAEFTEAMKAIVGSLQEQQAESEKQMAEALATLANAVKALTKTDEEKIAAKAAEVPTQSMQDIVMSIFGPDTQIDGNAARRKEFRGPDETQPQYQGRTGVDLIDVFMSGADQRSAQ